MKKIDWIAICLTVITVAELYFTGKIEKSFFLWGGYGFYKLWSLVL